MPGSCRSRSVGHASELLQRVTRSAGVDRLAGDGDAVDECRHVVGREEHGGRVEQDDVAARTALTVQDGHG